MKNFKVICTSNRAEKDGDDAFELTVGCEYTVFEKLAVPEQDTFVYALIEINEPILFDCRYFSELNGPCEVALLEERVEAEIADLDRNWKGINAKLDQLENASK